MDWRERIAIEPGKRSGKPCIRGTRIAVADILSYLAGGETEEALLAEFPQLSREDVRAALAYPTTASGIPSGWRQSEAAA